jgi:hypothetical protein
MPCSSRRLNSESSPAPSGVLGWRFVASSWRLTGPDRPDQSTTAGHHVAHDGPATRSGYRASIRHRGVERAVPGNGRGGKRRVCGRLQRQRDIRRAVPAATASDVGDTYSDNTNLAGDAVIYLWHTVAGEWVTVSVGGLLLSSGSVNTRQRYGVS